MSLARLQDLHGRVALVTGGSRGLGLQMAEALGELGARVVITARKADELAQAKARLEAQGIEVLPIACDSACCATSRTWSPRCSPPSGRSTCSSIE